MSSTDTRRVTALEFRKWLRSDRTLSHVAWATAQAILDHLNRDGGGCFVALQTLADEARMGNSTIRRGVSELRDAHVISTEYVKLRRDGATTVIAKRQPWQPGRGPGVGWVLAIEATLPTETARSERLTGSETATSGHVPTGGNRSETKPETARSGRQGAPSLPSEVLSAPPPEEGGAYAKQSAPPWLEDDAYVDSGARTELAPAMSTDFTHVRAREARAGVGMAASDVCIEDDGLVGHGRDVIHALNLVTRWLGDEYIFDVEDADAMALIEAYCANPERISEIATAEIRRAVAARAAHHHEWVNSPRAAALAQAGVTTKLEDRIGGGR